MANLPSAAPLVKAEIYVFRVPVSTPVRTSFGVMHDRPAVILRLEDQDGFHGWGESFCNFPACGAEHRARLLQTVIVPHLFNIPFIDPASMWKELSHRVEVLALQTDEPGPLAQAVSCVDIALWDLAARRAGVPVHQLLGDGAMRSMPAYASGINPVGAGLTIEQARSDGYRIFKVKVGFGKAQDQATLEESLGALRQGESLAVDVNQAWSLAEAMSMVSSMENLPLLWMEEPLRSDSDMAAWRTLAARSPIPLAAGENMRGQRAFTDAVTSGAFAVLQPDVCKWGGLSMCRVVAGEIRDAGLKYCPHYLGGGIGLMASAHLLAATGGPGALEVDCNPNPLRALLAQPFPQMCEGRFALSDAPGLGVEPAMDALGEFRVFYASVCA